MTAHGSCEFSVDGFETCNYQREYLLDMNTRRLVKGNTNSSPVSVHIYKFDFSEYTDSASIQLRGYALEAKDNFPGRSSDPFFEVCRPHQSEESEDVTWMAVYRSEMIDK